MKRFRSALRVPLVTALMALCLVGGGCKNRRNKNAATLSELTPPKDAPAWESRFGVAFDDTYTPTSINLQGRAPNDVLDQQLFQARLGHAAVVLLVRVEQVWGKGRYQGRQTQYVEIEVGEALLGSLQKDAPETLMIEVDSSDELPGELKDEIMLLFIRWDGESDPPYHHHLMPADEELVALIKAMVKHAQAEGVLNAKGDESKRGGKRKRKRGRKGKQDDGGAELPAGPSKTEPEGDGAPVVPAGSGVEAEDPPPVTGPQPDASTGLQDLGGDDDAAASEAAPEPAPE